MQVKPESNLIYPLSEFYQQAGLPLPPVTRIAGGDMPEPYRTLLVHERDMTPTLEQAYGSGIGLRALQSSVRDEVFSRQVVLIAENQSDAPVLFGAIRIYLEHFPAEARGLVLESRQPLGTILRTQGMEHTSRPDAYFQVAADATINRALGLTESGLLYGRRNILSDRSQNTLARVVEILPRSAV